MDVIAQPNLINIVYPIEVFDFYSSTDLTIRYTRSRNCPFYNPSANVECLLPRCLCIGEDVPAKAAELRVIDISQPLLLPVPIHSFASISP